MPTPCKNSAHPSVCCVILWYSYLFLFFNDLLTYIRNHHLNLSLTLGFYCTDRKLNSFVDVFVDIVNPLLFRAL